MANNTRHNLTDAQEKHSCTRKSCYTNCWLRRTISIYVNAFLLACWPFMLTYKVSLSDRREKTKKHYTRTWAKIRVPFSHENIHTHKLLQNHPSPYLSILSSVLSRKVNRLDHWIFCLSVASNKTAVSWLVGRLMWSCHQNYLYISGQGTEPCTRNSMLAFAMSGVLKWSENLKQVHGWFWSLGFQLW